MSCRHKEWTRHAIRHAVEADDLEDEVNALEVQGYDVEWTVSNEPDPPAKPAVFTVHGTRVECNCADDKPKRKRRDTQPGG